MICLLSSGTFFGIYSHVKIAITILLSAASLAVSAGETVKQSFERYRTIIDRKPFGPEPVNFDPEAAPGSAAAAAQEGGELTEEQRTAEEQQLASNVRVSMINVSPSGVVKVGFTDSGISPPENYYLAVGSSQNGWSVKSADPGTESVTLAKGGVDVTVKLGESSGGKGGKASPSRSHGARAALKSQRPMTLEAQGGKMFGGGGLARLRRKRQEERAREREEAEKKAMAAEEERIAREEREAAEAEEKRRNEEERAQQREALLQIQEQLRKQRQEREAAAQESGAENEGE